MAIKLFSYSNIVDFLYKLIMFVVFVAFAMFFIYFIDHFDIENGILIVFIGILFLAVYFLLVYLTMPLSVQLYILIKFGVPVSRDEADYFSRLFTTNNASGKWYPLNELWDIPKENRKQALFSIAFQILGYSYHKPIKKNNKLHINFKRYFLKKEYSPADELLKYKKLFDEGAITLEEYEKKKYELLKL